MLTKFAEQLLQQSILVRFTPAAYQAISLAQEEFYLFHHEVLDTEHLLLGLVAQRTGLASKALEFEGVSLLKARKEVEIISGIGCATQDVEITFTLQVKQILEMALDAAEKLGYQTISTGHLLLGIIRQGCQEGLSFLEQGVAVWVLRNLKVNLSKLENQLQQHLKANLHMENNTNAVHVLIHPIERVSFVCSYPSGKISGRLAAYFISWLISCVDSVKPGGVLKWNAGFKLPNENILALGNVYTYRERPKQSIRSYIEFIPDLVVQIKTSNELLLPIQENIQHLLELGTQVAVLIDADNRTFTVYRSSGEVTALTDGDTFTIPELLPDWQLPISRIWSSKIECV